MESRFLVDSTETDDGDLNLLLSNVRHRMGSGIELAGIDLRWQVDVLPEIRGLTARDALAIKLILMESLSNVLHHSKAKTATLTASYDEKESMIVICVRDDRCGFNPADTDAGRGLSKYAQADRKHLDRRCDRHRFFVGTRDNSPNRIEGVAACLMDKTAAPCLVRG